MCSPDTLANVQLASQSAGTGLSTVGAVQNSISRKRAFDANAEIAETQARDALARGVQDETLIRQRAAQLKGTQRARMAASGLDLTTGSPLDILEGTDYMAEQDTATVRENSLREARGLQREARNYRRASSAENPYVAGGSTLLTGASSVADRWLTYKNKGVRGY